MEYTHLFFEQSYLCYPFSCINRSSLEEGDKIIMPASALDRLARLEIDFPILFEIQNPETGRSSHCGVLEFTSEEGKAFLPQWMMNNLNLQEDDLVQLKTTRLRKGTFFKLKPHKKRFTDVIINPKVVLEYALRRFSCLTIGDTIMISHNNDKFYLDIVETKPDSAISIIETDCEVEFVAALDYKEPEKVTKEEKELKFQPFTGIGRRLDGLANLASSSSTSGCVWSRSNEESHECKVGLRKHSGKVVFGSKNVSKNSEKPAKVSGVDDDPGDESLKKLGGHKFIAFTGKKYTLLTE